MTNEIKQPNHIYNLGWFDHHVEDLNQFLNGELSLDIFTINDISTYRGIIQYKLSKCDNWQSAKQVSTLVESAYWSYVEHYKNKES